MKVAAIVTALVHLALSQVFNQGGDTCGSGDNCETSARVCEYVLLNPRIDENELIRDVNTIPNGFPHMVAIGYPSAVVDNEVDWLCSGTLITRKYVLTAAHCLEITDGRKAIWVRLGDTDLRNGTDDFNAQTLPVKTCFKSPKYNRLERYNDIGIIQMEGRVKFVSGVVEPACLPMAASLPTGTALVTDWGRNRVQNGGSDREQRLKRSEHELLPMETCTQSFSILSESSRKKVLPSGLDEETMICARALQPETASCIGSSGAPLEVELNKTSCTFTVFGISSFGFGCNKIEEPTIYTKVYPYLSWIQGIVCK